jgi:hypothetical protein
MSELKLSLLADLERKVGELVISVISCPSIFISENTLACRKNVVMVTLTTGIG